MKCEQESAGFCKAKISYNHFIQNKLCEDCCMYCQRWIKKECDLICNITKKEGNKNEI